MMRALLVSLLLIMATFAAAYATFSRMGAQSIEHPRGISLREESSRAGGRGGFFFFYHSARGHRGGGLHGGK